MARDLKADQQMLSAVLAHAQNREIPRAAAIAEQALAEGFEHPLLLNVLAAHLEQEGKFEAAVRLLERAVAIAPEDVPARNALALCLQRVDRPQEALQHVEELLKTLPGPGIRARQQGQRSDRARVTRTGAGEPPACASSSIPSVSRPWALLASIATHRGEHAEARRWAERVLAQVPGYPHAVLSLAAADLAERRLRARRPRLRDLLADPRVGPSERARAQGLLGDVLDAAGRYPEAFAAYSALQ